MNDVKKPLSLDELKRLFNKDKPTFICLKNAAGQYECRWNRSTVNALKEKFEEITHALQKESLPAGIYYFYSKNSQIQGSTEYVWPVGVGNYDTALEVRAPVHTIQAKSENVWSVTDAVRILTENETYKMKIESLEDKISELQEYIDLVEEKLKTGTSLNEDGEASKNKFISDFKDIMELAAPTIDKILSIQEKRVNLLSGGQKKQEETIPDREDGGIHPKHPLFRQYIHNMITQGTADEQANELTYLQTNFPAVYKNVCDHYGVDLTDSDSQEEITE